VGWRAEWRREKEKKMKDWRMEEKKRGYARERAARLQVVDDSAVRLEARLGREEPKARNCSLCEHYRGSSRATVLDRRGLRKRTSHLI
jgi:hypothetical protein